MCTLAVIDCLHFNDNLTKPLFVVTVVLSEYATWVNKEFFAGTCVKRRINPCFVNACPIIMIILDVFYVVHHFFLYRSVIKIEVKLPIVMSRCMVCSVYVGTPFSPIWAYCACLLNTLLTSCQLQ